MQHRIRPAVGVNKENSTMNAARTHTQSEVQNNPCVILNEGRGWPERRDKIMRIQKWWTSSSHEVCNYTSSLPVCTPAITAIDKNNHLEKKRKDTPVSEGFFLDLFPAVIPLSPLSCFPVSPTSSRLRQKTLSSYMIYCP